MNNDFCSRFELEVEKNLKSFGVDFYKTDALRLGVAVSGGADSVSLLIALSEISKKYNFSLFVITVNHNIREAEETAGDAQFVMQLCDDLKKQGIDVSAKLYELKRGEVSSSAAVRQNGTEEAARYLRYKAFDDFIKENSLNFLCLAHNKNDQLETLLMRFLQGSYEESSVGIKPVRDKFLRPLLTIERTNIEEYLEKKQVSYRTDSTNLETNYLRNKIRLKLIPFLNDEFEGWDKSVLSGMEKSVDDAQIIKQLVEGIEISETDCGAGVRSDLFASCFDGVKIRLLMKMCNLCGEKKRIPYVFLKDAIESFHRLYCGTENRTVSKVFDEIEIIFNKENILVKKYAKQQTDLIFSDIIEESGTFSFPFGILSVEENGDGSVDICVNDEVSVKGLPLPLCVRNCRIDDEIEAKDGSFKSIADVFSDWHVGESEKCLIPVIQKLNSSEQEIICILGKVYGFNNWIVNRWIIK